MSIVVIANVLLDGVARHWGMGDARIEAVASLLHERAPREVPPLREPPTSLISSLQLKRSPGMFREVPPGMTAIEPTHLLSNGRYAVALRANGAGASRRGNARDHALARRRAARRARLVLPRPLGPPAAAGLADPASRRPTRPRTTTAACTPTASPSARPGPSWRRRRRSGSAPRTTSSSASVVLHNCGERTLDLELLSSFEVTLADPRADESHPAFSNLFVSAEWQAHHQAIVFARKPRLVTDKGLRRRQLPRRGRAGERRGQDPGRSPALARPQPRRQPSARRRSTSRRPPPEGSDGATLDTGLDPVAAFAVRLQIAPNAKVRLTFCTAASRRRGDAARRDRQVPPGRQHRARLADVGDADRHPPARDAHQRRELRGDPDALDRALALARRARTCAPPRRATSATGACSGASASRATGRSSSSRPASAQGLGLLRSLAQALRLWSWGGVACDLVVVNHEPASYLMPLSRAIASLKEAHAAAIAAQPGSADTGFHLLQSSDLHADEIATLRALARVRLNADGRPLAHHVQELVELHERSFQERQGDVGRRARRRDGRRSRARADRPIGDFAPAGGEFRFDVSALSRPARPWVNVLANPRLRRPDQRGRRRLQLGAEQPPQHADAVVERRRRRPGRRVVRAAGPAHAARPGA